MNTELLTVALSRYGLVEVPGPKDNSTIIEMAADAGFGSDYIHDSIAWCSMFMNWVAFKVAYERSHSLAARSWLEVGEKVDNCQDADVVILWRDDPAGPFGHVGMPICQRDGMIWILAGNQGNMVTIMGFPTNRILGFRKLRKISS